MEDKMDISSTSPEDQKEKEKDAVTQDDIIKSKIKQNFSAEVEAKLPELRKLALQDGKLHEAIELLLALEKQTRAGEDLPSTIIVACFMVQLCFEAKNWIALKDALVHISKRRGQLKEVIQKMVVGAMNLLDKIEDMATKLGLIDTLRLITEGKIFVEIERARLTRILAKIKEENGEVSEAAEILQEVQPETYGAMDPREKIDIILEQVRLCLDKRDFIRAQIISRKVTTKAIENSEFQDLKLRYYELMIRYYSHNNDYFNICKSYRAMYDTKCIQDNPEKWKQLLRYIVVYVVLAPHNNEQSDLIHRTNEDQQLIEVPEYQTLLKFFITRTLVRWPILQHTYTPILNDLPIFKEESGATLWKDLHARVVEHNISVIAEYYERIRTNRLAELLDLSEKETEKFISDMVSSGSVWAKIDRPKAIVVFRKRQEPNEILNNWSHNISELLELLEKTCHLIHRENMVHHL